MYILSRSRNAGPACPWAFRDVKEQSSQAYGAVVATNVIFSRIVDREAFGRQTSVRAELVEGLRDDDPPAEGELLTLREGRFVDESGAEIVSCTRLYCYRDGTMRFIRSTEEASATAA